MTLLHSRVRSRVAFTLIELLVVIAIIAVLVSLLMAAVFYAYGRMADVGARNDISGQAAAMQTFVAEYKYRGYPPHQLRLCSNRSQYGQNGTNALDQVSLSFIDALWPNIGSFQNVQWATPLANKPINEVLDGDQVMVFVLGGCTTQTAAGFAFYGFATNSKDPSLVVSNPNVGKKGPFFNFPANRVYVRNQGQTASFPSFKDYYQQQPYLYFSSHTVENGYNPYFPTNSTYSITLPNTTGGGTATVQAYYQTAPNPPNSRGVYQMPKAFQILCAGRDGNFNSSSVNANAFLWSPSQVGNLTPAGQDDFANFSDSKLGVSQ